ncbi:ribonuclease HII [Salininema proteolyticum]|uniref:Ribonuclease HII n=1 Tax=Salininema proteolyticum TaxID=1607685 RepID=A0ABV8TZK1_9ACTN
MTLRPRRARVSRRAGLYACESALARNGLGPVAGVDEAGRGCCAGPLVVAAVVLPPSSRVPELNDSKLLTEAGRERVYAALERSRVPSATVVYEASEVDARGVGACNLEGMRRAVARLEARPRYALTDGFAVSGMPCPSLGVVKGDRTVAAIAAAGVVAKVERDRRMQELDALYPEYGFAGHKGYGTEGHMRALSEHGPCPEHRMSFSNVAALAGAGRADGRVE